MKRTVKKIKPDHLFNKKQWHLLSEEISDNPMIKRYWLKQQKRQLAKLKKRRYFKN
ncbi:hypothetical protein [Mycoplasmoides genitalium]|uniref:hypothetical protein n=1 Tax=Mycoplasmoides genitalium TaxID=2097 RepID=UPI0001B418BB|nr:hypothetical protein [Mycoplasmoides genitalium]